MAGFEGVVPALAQALSNRGYEVLTPVQEAVLAPELGDADALISAQTGSGKTVAFGLMLAPTLLQGAERFERAPSPLALAVAPTRELALQVKRELEWLFELTGARVASCVGGMDMRDERRALQRGAHIVVGTPGRLRDHIERGSLNMTGLKAVVLDEADEMLDLGFREDLEYILNAAPSERRTLMLSATVPRAIANLAKRYQRDAVRISTTAEREQHLDIEYRALTVMPNDRENAIINLLRYIEPQSALVFCATRATVNHMTSRFANRGFSVVALSGELNQAARTHALQAMRDGRARVCIATDVAARGIDLPNLDLVIHADLPRGRDTLLHRSGRTGRAGRKGVSALIVPHNWRKRVERLLASANINATWAKPPSVEDVLRRDRERIFADPALTEDLSQDEQNSAQELLQLHGPEQIAAAFIRLHMAGQTAPEELSDTAPIEHKKKQRSDFTDGVWFSLSVGHEHKAEPRWLLPMLCRAGGITNRDIGAIRIHQSETHVELAPECVEQFLATVGPSRKMEKTITVDRLQGAPHIPKDGPGEQHKPRGKHKSRDKYKTKEKYRPKAARDRSGDRSGDGAKLSPSEMPREPSEESRIDASSKKLHMKKKPRSDASSDEARLNDLLDGENFADKAGKKAKPKKPKMSLKVRKSKRAKAEFKTQQPGKPGFGPIKRKKPKV